MLTKEQWIGVLDFVKEIGAKLIVSVANCPGLHSADEPWTPVEAEKLFGLSKEYGVPIDAAEFANEPNMMADTGFPKIHTGRLQKRPGFILCMAERKLSGMYLCGTKHHWRR